MADTVFFFRKSTFASLLGGWENLDDLTNPAFQPLKKFLEILTDSPNQAPIRPICDPIGSADSGVASGTFETEKKEE